jgi:DNA-binding transcriptional ArsR family regulator
MGERMQSKKEEVIKKFLKEKKVTPEFILELTDKLADMATITPAGEVLIERGCSIKDKVALITIARFLGSQLKEEIKTEVKAESTVEEVARYAGISKPVASARLKDLKDEGLLESPARGIFRVRSVFQAEKWISSLHKKYVGNGGRRNEQD